MTFKKFSKDGLVLYSPQWVTRFDDLTCAYTTRLGGFSQGPYASLNLGYVEGDDEEKVKRNRNLVGNALDFAPTKWKGSKQVHGCRIIHVDKDSQRLQADGLITDRRNLLLYVLLADCLGITVYDSITPSVGVAHAGWRGSIAGISGRLVEELSRGEKTAPENFWAALGPCINSCCYEVDEPVLTPLFERWDFAEEVVIGFESGHAHLDLKLLNYHILLKAGLDPAKISISEACTSCDSEEFFSYRRSGGDTGRLAAMIGLKL